MIIKISDSVIKKAIEKKVYEAIDKADKEFGVMGRKNFVFPEIQFDQSTKRAGAFGPERGVVKFFFSVLIAKYNFDDFDDTITHEVAHFVDYVMHNGWRQTTAGNIIAHDVTFKNIHRQLGGNGGRGVIIIKYLHHIKGNNQSVHIFMRVNAVNIKSPI